MDGLVVPGARRGCIAFSGSVAARGVQPRAAQGTACPAGRIRQAVERATPRRHPARAAVVSYSVPARAQATEGVPICFVVMLRSCRLNTAAAVWQPVAVHGRFAAGALGVEASACPTQPRCSLVAVGEAAATGPLGPEVIGGVLVIEGMATCLASVIPFAVCSG